jgi:serine/threonine protein kinase
MSYCLNPQCRHPQNPDNDDFCVSCGSKLLLRERYRAIKPIGNGGFGRTFLAVDEDKPSKPFCVIKQFYPQSQGVSTMQKAEELFNHEAVRLEELGQHPQIPSLLAHFTLDKRQYLVQEFIDGQNLLQELSQQGTFNEGQIRRLLTDLLPVLHFCHERQVIHRDIKPENIILRVKDIKSVLVDFGASKFVTNNSPDASGTIIGSQEYMAPEQLRGNAIFASDIYSLGATCIRLLTGRAPFECYDVHNGIWCWEKYVNTSVSNQLISVIDKMLESAPVNRYQTAVEVLRDLGQNSPVIVPNTIITKPVTQSLPTSPPVVAPQTKNQIDSELDEMKTMFLGKAKPQNNPPNPLPQSQTKSVKKNIIDDELEQLKEKYQGNNSSPQ